MEIHMENTVNAQSIVALPFWDRPKNRERGISFPLTDSQVTARERLSAEFAALLTPERLLTCGAYITPGETKTSKKGESYTPLMVALTFMSPALTYQPPFRNSRAAIAAPTNADRDSANVPSAEPGL